jgi:xylulokinase
MPYYLGLDISTTATKALLLDETGRVVQVASSEYSYETPFPLWCEQSPHLWWRATLESIQAVISKSSVKAHDIKGVGMTGQMHGLVLMDAHGEVLRPAILWNDQRTGEQCDLIRSRIGKQRLINLTGNDALAGFTAPKILWVQQNEPYVYQKINHVLLPKDYVRYRLTNQYAMDRAGGSGTLLFHLKKRDWSVEVMQALDINPDWFSSTFEGTQITGEITSESASATGLIAGTPVFAGGGDQAAGAVGVGAVSEGILSLSLGTSGVVFASVNSPLIEPKGRLHAFCHAVPDKWHLMGVMLSAAGSLRWFRDTFSPGTDFDTLLKSVKKIPVGSEGLLFLPYLTGERTPYPDPLARAVFIGLTVRHGLPHMTRALLEGVAFGLRDSFELMKGTGLGTINQVRISGGGAKSDIWRQILADVLQVELVTVNSMEGAAFGAALLAATGAGVFPDISAACQSAIQLTGSTFPELDADFYQDIYSIYRDLYPDLRKTFHRISKLS